jgi:hypothetical protein
MIEGLSSHINISFILTTCLSFYLWNRLANWPNWLPWALIIWLAFQGALGYSGFYLDTLTLPPRFPLIAIPMLTLVFLGVFVHPFNKFENGLSLRSLLLVHLVRIPVEIVLFWLYSEKTIPELMTFEGRNFDILAGLSAPIIFFFGFEDSKPRRALQLIWNFFGLGLLLNIIVNAVLSVPFPIQQFAFDQPNIAILYFPFLWLPGFVVPCVLFAHLVSIKKLLKPS